MHRHKKRNLKNLLLIEELESSIKSLHYLKNHLLRVASLTTPKGKGFKISFWFLYHKLFLSQQKTMVVVVFMSTRITTKSQSQDIIFLYFIFYDLKRSLLKSQVLLEHIKCEAKVLMYPLLTIGLYPSKFSHFRNNFNIAFLHIYVIKQIRNELSDI